MGKSKLCGVRGWGKKLCGVRGWEKEIYMIISRDKTRTVVTGSSGRATLDDSLSPSFCVSLSPSFCVATADEPDWDEKCMDFHECLSNCEVFKKITNGAKLTSVGEGDFCSVGEVQLSPQFQWRGMWPFQWRFQWRNVIFVAISVAGNVGFLMEYAIE